MSDQNRTWKLEDHLCRSCGGRILRCVTGNGMTPGGNPLFKCADCGECISGISPDVLCWCGFHHRNQHAKAYKCVPFSILKERPELLNAFRSCGCEPGRSEVGIMLKSSFHKTER